MKQRDDLRWLAGSAVLEASALALLAGCSGALEVPVGGTEVARPMCTTQDEARALARANGLESLRVADTAHHAIGQPLVLNPGKVPLPGKDEIEALLNPENKHARRQVAQLGKALFWDMAVGSDGQACASCHFAAGADSRIKNQLDPAINRVENHRQGDVKGFHFARDAADLEFQLVGGRKGFNYTLKADDYPFVKDIGADNANGQNVVPVTVGGVQTLGPAAGNTNDVVSSQGAFFTQFQAVAGNPFDPFVLNSFPVPLRDKGTTQTNPLGFQVSAPGGAHGGKTNVRQAEPRNTPSMINAVFNLHNFWDGRANFYFNGQTPFGQTDPNAFILVNECGKLVQRKLRLPFASLASQSVGPPLSVFEMSFAGRISPEIGKKMAHRHVLASQQVSPGDSLLGEPLSRFGPSPTGKGIDIIYRDAIRQVFRKELWDSHKLVGLPSATAAALSPNVPYQNLGQPQVYDVGSVPDGVEGYTQMEVNFPLFFGVAVMLYEAELVADQSRFDLFMEGKENLTNAEVVGLQVFVGKGKCVNCHGGPELSNATVRHTQAGKNLIEPMIMGNGQPAIYDSGFYNIGVVPTVEDLGRGGKGPGGRPLASSRQALFFKDGFDGPIDFPVIGVPVRDVVPVGPELVHGICQKPILRSTEAPGVDVCRDLNCNGVCDADDEVIVQRDAVDGAFKTPQLRNVELTGPYWHNGGILTLMQVVSFYDQGGNFCRFNFPDLDPDIQPLGLSDGEKTGLVSFLLTLTDERVRHVMAPFDHPELRVPNGHPGDEDGTFIDVRFAGEQALDAPLAIPAVGASGLPACQEIKPFHVALNPALTHFDITAPVANTPCQRPDDPHQ